MREVDIQADMVADAKKAGAWAFKSSNRFLVGVPDLFIQYPGFTTTIIEIKYLSVMPKNGVIKFDITEHQKRHINGINRTGGLAGWAGVVKLRGQGEFAIAVGRNTGKAAVGMILDSKRDNLVYWTYKRRGIPWPMREVVIAISKMNWR